MVVFWRRTAHLTGFVELLLQPGHRHLLQPCETSLLEEVFREAPNKSGEMSAEERARESSHPPHLSRVTTPPSQQGSKLGRHNRKQYQCHNMVSVTLYMENRRFSFLYLYSITQQEQRYFSQFGRMLSSVFIEQFSVLHLHCDKCFDLFSLISLS